MPLTHATGLNRERIRFGALSLPGGANPWNHGDRDGNYCRVHIEGGNVQFRCAAGPVPPFIMAVQVTSAGQDSDPRLLQIGLKRLLIVFTRTVASVPTVMWIYSDSDGADWSSPVALFPAGSKHPTLNTAHGRPVVFGAYSGGNILIRIQEKGDAAPGAAFTLLTNSGAALAVADDTFHFSPMGEQPKRWVLVAVPSGGTTPQEYSSPDDMQTVIQVS